MGKFLNNTLNEFEISGHRKVPAPTEEDIQTLKDLTHNNHNKRTG
jgi:hypothetical protein